MTRKPYVLLEVWVALFVACLITANIVAVKLAQFGPWIMQVGTVIFPISYILGDVLTEVYGYRIARKVIWLGFGGNLVAVAAITVAIKLPPAPFWDQQVAFSSALGYAPRLLIATFSAYLAGEFGNSIVLAKLELRTQGRWLWLRTTTSTLVGEGSTQLSLV
jgi:uncharacterized integral membrane protein (TIGR00697 family)